ncbi:MAG: carboxypeptidase [Cyanobium sp. ARS6]|nr:carboxypeptidase [Cyanobium sp. ARS6]
MSRAVVTRSRKRDSSRDDIPIARRRRSSQPRRGSGLGLLLSCVALFSLSLAAVLFVPELLPDRTRIQVIEGIDEQPGQDGRLLGHFPYPEALVDQLVPVEAGIELHRDAALSLDAMRRAAAADGVDLRLLSGYRSQELQKSIFFDVKSERNQTAAERAKVSAPPGYSEHSTGYAVDLGDGADPATNLSAAFERTAAFSWLQDHAASYHFTLSFPAVNSQGVSYEPWHWRFEGSADALRRFEPARRLANGG